MLLFSLVFLPALKVWGAPFRCLVGKPGPLPWQRVMSPFTGKETKKDKAIVRKFPSAVSSSSVALTDT